MRGNEITFIRHNLNPFEIKLAQKLKKIGYEINLVSFFKIKDEYNDLFDKQIYLIKKQEKNKSKITKVLRLPKFILSLRKIKKGSIIIGISEPNWFVTLNFILLKNRSKSRIYFPYDITYFRKKDYKNTKWYEKISEKYNYHHCDGIIHKGPEEELNWLPEKFKATEIPSIQFLPYCNDDLMINIDEKNLEKKLSKKEGGIHLVYVGRAVHNSPYRFSDIEIFKKIVDQKLYLHLYAINHDIIAEDPEYKELMKNKYFRLHEPIYGAELQKELSKYDWGSNIFHTNFEKMKKEWAATAYGNKISTYLEAGIPSIANEEMKFSADIIKQNKFGITIKNINELSKKLKNVDYKKIIKEIKKNRDKFTLTNNLDRLIEFIEKIRG